jgi:protein gp37
MGQETKIEWTHHTFNPWRGCSKVHAGCTNCYAEKNQGVAMNHITWGEVWQGGQRVVKAESGWSKPLTWARDAARAGERRRVFCASLADVLEVPADGPTGHRGAVVALARRRLSDARARLWDVIRRSAFMSPRFIEPVVHTSVTSREWYPGLDWLLLTKRPENWHLVPEDVRPLAWLGTSISDQKTADEWVPRLLKAEGFRLRFLSVEPLTGPVDLSAWLPRDRYFLARCERCGHTGTSERFIEVRYADDSDVLCPQCRHGLQREVDGINWVIVGGESGPRARPCNVEWVRDIVRQCREASVRCFVKQLGSRPEHEVYADPVPFQDGPVSWNERLNLEDSKGGDMSEWPEDLRVREFPEARHA